MILDFNNEDEDFQRITKMIFTQCLLTGAISGFPQAICNRQWAKGKLPCEAFIAYLCAPKGSVSR
jgi:hypothetical protein